ncbi:MAG: hypothetical protein OXE84_00745 [Rhodobacteraceae bacterium]|nr:hypothetical protein [Paracoccaceae bacterium]MCY4197561.1 hypothetical protein [Paracoccaceae bacterium]
MTLSSKKPYSKAVAQRFELARFVADRVRSEGLSENQWLISSDLSTTRQKFQRAFAAEFLCPIDSLVDFLNGDFSESGVEDAADHYDVNEITRQDTRCAAIQSVTQTSAAKR